MADPKRDEHGRFVGAGKAPEDGPNYTDIGLEDATARVSVDPSQELDEEDVLRLVGLDPRAWEIKELRRRRVETADGERASVSVVARKRHVSLAEQLLDPTEVRDTLHEWLGRTAPAKRRPSAGQAAPDAFVLVLADWQIGGAANGMGTMDTVARVMAAFDAAEHRVHELRTAGRSIPRLEVLGLGDIVENCTGFYASQLFTVDMDTRAQMRTSWHLILAGLLKLAPLFETVTVRAVGGNHGEMHRVAGRQQTPSTDNLDLLAFDAVRLGLEERPGFDHVTVFQPQSALWDVMDVAGVPVGITHGHLFNGGQNPAAKAERWWRGQAFGRTPLAEARILFSGHYHSFAAAEWAEEGRAWFQAPAMDNGSQWFTDSSGLSSPPGMLSMRVGTACGPRGWSDLEIL